MCDIYFSKIPNAILIPGYFISIPYVYITGGLTDVWQAILIGTGIFILLVFIYFINGIGAGDVKLIVLICMYFEINNAVKFLIVVFFSGAFIGVIKILFNVLVNRSAYSGKTKIRFSIPILLSYCIFIISSGGI